MTIKAFLYEPIKQLSQNYEISAICNIPGNESVDWLGSWATPIHISIERKISLLKDIKSLFCLIREFSKNRYDAVHSVTPKAGLLAMLAAFICRIPVRTHTFTGQVWVTKTGIKRKFLKSFDWLIAKLATHVLVDSNSQLRFLIGEGVVSENHAQVLAEGSISGVDVTRFSPDAASRASIRERFGLNSHDVLILYLGRLTYDKGLYDLASAFARIPSQQAHLLIVGPDEDNMRQELLNLAGDSQGRMHFVGFTNEPERFMAAADIFCLPSYREGFGSVIIEAAAVGIPAIGSDIYGISDAIEHNTSGLLFSPRDSNKLAFQLDLLIADSELRLRLGMQARARAIAKFSSEYVSRAWLDYYQRIL